MFCRYRQLMQQMPATCLYAGLQLINNWDFYLRVFADKSNSFFFFSNY